MWPDAARVREALSRAGRRDATVEAITGAAISLALAAAVTAAVPLPVADRVPAGVALVAIGVAAGVIRARLRAPHLAARIERRAPGCQNVVITAAELLQRERDGLGSDAAPVSDYVGALVCRAAADQLARLDFGTIFPVRFPVAGVAASGALWLLAVTHAPSSRALSLAAAPVITGIDATVIPPAYAAEAPQRLRNPARITALAGSRVELSVHARAATVSIETLDGTQAMATTGPETFAATVTANADGYVVFEPAALGGRAGVRRLIGLSVAPDNPPEVRITAPARDLQLRDGHHTIDVAIAAHDDIGLASLRLHYTRVSGSGEQFTFKEADVPLAIVRTDRRTWTAHVSWHLDSLALGPGDMVVYRALAADDRPGAPPTESDSYIAEVVAPGGEAIVGASTDPDEDRYALSEQMVLQKTEKLVAARDTLSPQAYRDQAADIAAEQRKVRAEFVFMMGGEIGAENTDMTNLGEEAEAEGEGELMAGRLVNQGRNALLTSIRDMSRAATDLITPDGPKALGDERDALAQLQFAFAHSRIILRALTVREQLDLSRRLTGVLLDAARDTRPPTEPADQSRTVALRQALAGIAALAGTPTLGAGAEPAATRLAETVLRIDPSSTSLGAVATLLSDAATRIDQRRVVDARNLLDRAATALAAVLRAGLPTAPPEPRALDFGRLDGALADALRGTSGPP